VGDARGIDGTASIVQPLILPIFGGRSAHEVLSVLNGAPDKTAYDIVREYWILRSNLAAPGADRRIPIPTTTTTPRRPNRRRPSKPRGAGGCTTAWYRNTAFAPRSVTLKALPPPPPRSPRV